MINEIGRYAYNAFPSKLEIVDAFSKVIKNVNKVAVPAIILFSLTGVPGVGCGPVSYGICITACTSMATPVFMPACIVGCLSLAGPWCP
jgi:hypothetical protein